MRECYRPALLMCFHGPGLTLTYHRTVGQRLGPTYTLWVVSYMQSVPTRGALKLLMWAPSGPSPGKDAGTGSSRNGASGARCGGQPPSAPHSGAVQSLLPAHHARDPHRRNHCTQHGALRQARVRCRNRNLQEQRAVPGAAAGCPGRPAAVPHSRCCPAHQQGQEGTCSTRLSCNGVVSPLSCKRRLPEDSPKNA